MADDKKSIEQYLKENTKLYYDCKGSTINIKSILKRMGYYEPDCLKEWVVDPSFTYIKNIKYENVEEKCKHAYKIRELTTQKLFFNIPSFISIITNNLGLKIIRCDVDLCSKNIYNGFVTEGCDFTTIKSGMIVEGVVDFLVERKKDNKICIVQCETMFMEYTQVYDISCYLCSYYKSQQYRFLSYLAKDVFQLDYYPEVYILGLEMGKFYSIGIYILERCDVYPMFAGGSKAEKKYFDKLKTLSNDELREYKINNKGPTAKVEMFDPPLTCEQMLFKKPLKGTSTRSLRNNKI